MFLLVGKRCFQKRTQKILDNLPKGFTTVLIDESFFFFDSFVKKMWVDPRECKPVVRTTTGSHRHFCMFGAIS